MWRIIIVLLGLVLTTPAVSVAQNVAEPTTEHFSSHGLQNTDAWFLGGEFVGALALGFFAPDFIVSSQPSDLTCADAWCETNGFDDALRDVFVADDAQAAASASHVFALGLTPALVMGSFVTGAALAGDWTYAVQDVVIMLDAFMLSTGLNTLAKVGARRQRPGFHYGRQDELETGLGTDEFVSFYSGDTTWAFTLAASGTTLAYLRGYWFAPYVAAASGAFALTGGILRMSADMHWATDVLVGAAAGVVVGAGLPLLLHRRETTQTTLSLSPSIGAEQQSIILHGTW